MMNVTLWQARFEEWLRGRHRGERTVRNYVGELRPFFEFLASLGIDTLANVRRDDIEEYRNHLHHLTWRGHRLQPGTQANRLTAVKMFMRYLARARFIAFDPAAEVEVPRLPQTLPRVPLTERETVRLLESCTGNNPLDIRNRAILEVLYSTAIRNTELRSLTLDAVNLHAGQVRVLGKGRKMRMLPLGEHAVAWLRDYLDRARPRLVRSRDQRVLFLSYRGHPLERGALAKLIAALARRAGFDKTVTPHLLRNCCLTHMLKNGAELRHLQEMAGHASPETTQRYTRVEVTNLRRVLQRCHPRERRRT